MKDLIKRISQLQNQISSKQAILLSNPSDIYYFTKFQYLVPTEREAFVFITKKNHYLIHASFSPIGPDALAIKLAGCNLDKFSEHINHIIKTDKIEEILVDESSLFVNEHQILKNNKIQLSKLDKNLVWQLRTAKNDTEIESIRQASLIAKQALNKILAELREGITEKEVKLSLEMTMRKLGSEKNAFPLIVAFGEHSALPHHQPTDTKLEQGMAILIDMGAVVNNYCSDITRTIWFGNQADPEFLKIEKIVKQAYQAVINLLEKNKNYFSDTNLESKNENQASDSRENQTITNNQTITTLTAKDLDTAARSVINNHGYQKHFMHTTGHGVGIDVHEPPSLNWKNNFLIKENMIVTVEPGIYLEGKFGYRYENTILLKADKVNREAREGTIGYRIEELTK